MVLFQKWRHFGLPALLVYWIMNPGNPVFAGDPYSGICQKNAFRLKPRLAAAAAAVHAPLPKIKLTGITTILRGKRALLKVELPGKPPEKAESYILTEGQKVGPIEVIRINEKTAQVTVDYSGTITNLTFEKPTPTTAPRPVPSASRWQAMQYRTVYH